MQTEGYFPTCTKPMNVMRNTLMQKLITFILLFYAARCAGQTNTFDKFEQDTIRFATLSLDKVTVLMLDNAAIMLDFELFYEKLAMERQGCAKQIRSRQRLANDPVVKNQLRNYEKQYRLLDSVFQDIRKQRSKRDTFNVDYSGFRTAGSPFGDFLPALIESSQCMIFNTKQEFQSVIIRQKGWKRNSPMHSSGSTLYFLPGQNKYFWSRWDFST